MLLNIYDPISLVYPDNPLFLPSWKCAERNLELTGFPSQKRMGPSLGGEVSIGV